MIPQGRYVIGLVFLCLIFYVSRKTYLYYYDTIIPQVSIIGFEEGSAYAGDVAGVLKGLSRYKISHISMWLDNNLLHKDFKINRKQFEHPILIPVATIADGKHLIKFEIVDGTRHQNKIAIERNFYTDNVELQASLLSLAYGGRVSQGHCLHIQVQVNKPIKQIVAHTLSNEYEFFSEGKNSLIYETFIPIECEQDADEYPFSVEVLDRRGNKIVLDGKFTVVAVPFKRTTVSVTGNRLKEELEFTHKQEKDLEVELEKITAASSKEKMWVAPFEVPLVMKRVTTDFGSIRTSQDRGRRVHKALDLTTDLHGVIWASNNGIVVLKDRFNHSGNTVILDHGYGILSLYYHLNDFADNLEIGQKVKKGHPLGHMGKTGYASGDHLHWEMRVRNMAVDPMQWTQHVM